MRHLDYSSGVIQSRFIRHIMTLLTALTRRRTVRSDRQSYLIHTDSIHFKKRNIESRQSSSTLLPPSFYLGQTSHPIRTSPPTPSNLSTHLNDKQDEESQTKAWTSHSGDNDDCGFRHRHLLRRSIVHLHSSPSSPHSPSCRVLLPLSRQTTRLG